MFLTPNVCPGLPHPAVERSPASGKGITFPRRRPAERLVPVISRTETSGATRRIADLRRAQPADATLKNLLEVLSAKLALCASLPVYEWEAGAEGYEKCAATFRFLAEEERRSANDVIDRLREHLEQRSNTQGGKA
jgi:hypothetical protein